MQRSRLLLALLTVGVGGPGGAHAQELRKLADWPAGPAAIAVPPPPRAVGVPDSVRQKVGYHHWKGAAIGAGAGAVVGLLLFLGAGVSCSDCASNDPSAPAVSLVGAGLGGAFGFLVGLASPKYKWVPSTELQDGLGPPNY